MDKGKKKRLSRAKSRAVKSINFSLLPDELLGIISSHLPDEDIPYFALTCKKFLRGIIYTKRKFSFKEEYTISSMSRLNEIPDFYYSTLVRHLAIISGKVNVLKVTHEFDFNKSDIIKALMKGHVNVADYLIRNVHRLNTGYIHSTVCNIVTSDVLKIVRSGHVQSLQWIKSNISDLRDISDHLLMEAVDDKLPNVVKWLLDTYSFVYYVIHDSISISVGNDDVDSFILLNAHHDNRRLEYYVKAALDRGANGIVKYLIQHINIRTILCQDSEHNNLTEHRIICSFVKDDDLDGLKIALSLGYTMGDILYHQQALIIAGRRNSVRVFGHMLSLLSDDDVYTSTVIGNVVSQIIVCGGNSIPCLKQIFYGKWKNGISQGAMREGIETIFSERYQNYIDFFTYEIGLEIENGRYTVLY